MKDRWTEHDVSQLPAGEHRDFERKSGALLSGTGWRNTLAKALSAFANSGGGSLILGVKDKGDFDGVEPKRGRATTKDWLEQIVVNLLEHPLENFRVHEVEPSSPSQIPANKVLVVIDVADSNLAPHQSKEDRVYYHREGSHSTPAPHFYLELLRTSAFWQTKSKRFNENKELSTAEQRPFKPWVAGSSPARLTTHSFRVSHLGGGQVTGCHPAGPI